jgi:hypothetical protein
MARNTASNDLPMQLPDNAVSFDADAFDDLIRNQGVRMVHWRSMRCPVGMVDPDDIMRRPHEHHQGCSNGFVYTRAGEVTCSFLGNSKEVNLRDYGRMDSAAVQVTFPRTYDDKPTTPIQMCQYDRLFLKEEAITVVNWHTFAAHVTGRDRLQFPAVTVNDLMDAHGKTYVAGLDFDIVEGQIVWRGVGPGAGTVCSVRYSYRPFWYVERMIHEVRVAQVEDDYGNRNLIRMPQQASLKREAWFEKEQRDSEAPNPTSPRQKQGPSDGGFGPR